VASKKDNKKAPKNVPEKINVEALLGEGAETLDDAAEIEILDPAEGLSAAAAAGTVSEDALAAANAEKEKYYDLWLRSRADFENLKKRVDRERMDERTQAAATLIQEILPVVDNLERALAGAQTDDPFHEGVSLIHRQLKETLLTAGLEPIDALGASFDPLFHEAVATERTDRFEPNRVLEEIQKGYTYKGKVLRPSLVRVSARPLESSEKEPAGHNAEVEEI